MRGPLENRLHSFKAMLDDDEIHFQVLTSLPVLASLRVAETGNGVDSGARRISAFLMLFTSLSCWPNPT